MNQMNRDISKYPWSKDLLNPKCPEFALFTILTNGYGWITPKGRTTHAVELKQTLQNTFDSKSEKLEIKKCHALLNVLYEDYKSR